MTAYFSGITNMKNSDFREKVLEVVSRIPSGSTATYKEVAIRAGNSKAARAVGAILHTNHNPTVPCHRVVRSDGGIGGYNRGVEEKKKILEREKNV